MMFVLSFVLCQEQGWMKIITGMERFMHITAIKYIYCGGIKKIRTRYVVIPFGNLQYNVAYALVYVRMKKTNVMTVKDEYTKYVGGQNVLTVMNKNFHL